ncbi:MAG: HesA/MoeB/ThiF family protein [Candidatus Saganbacteria bacterium]|nr:HesA/MoeB/ThiF family protein [Candidatus Saganbacteria bacterium]
MQRYLRQMMLPDFGEEGQKKLLAAKVLIVGVGGLGSPVADYLVRGGVGVVGLVDSDKLELSNLHRQLLYTEKDLGKNKAEASAEYLRQVNGEIKIIPHVLRLDVNNVNAIIKNYDVIVDCADNFSTRYVLNDACWMAKKPLVHGGVLKYEGQAMVILPGKGPCYRCLFPEAPDETIVPPPRANGVLGMVPGIIGLVQATEVFKLILGVGDLLVGEMLIYNVLEMSFHKIKVPKNPACLYCRLT